MPKDQTGSGKTLKGTASVMSINFVDIKLSLAASARRITQQLTLTFSLALPPPFTLFQTFHLSQTVYHSTNTSSLPEPLLHFSS